MSEPTDGCPQNTPHGTANTNTLAPLVPPPADARIDQIIAFYRARHSNVDAQYRRFEQEAETLVAMASDGPHDRALADWLEENPPDPWTIVHLIKLAAKAAISDANRAKATKLSDAQRAEIVRRFHARPERVSKNAFEQRTAREFGVSAKTIERTLKGASDKPA